MEFNKKQSAILYLDSKGFYFYEQTLPNVLSLAFLETSVKDMDVLNAAQLTEQIKSFVTQYSIAPAAISIVLSPNVTFEKDITGLSGEDQDNAVKKFTDTIPFESVLAKSYPIDKGVKVIGCNEDLYDELKLSFKSISFVVESIIPYQMLGSDQALLQNVLVDNISLLLRRLDRYKQYTMHAEKTKPQTVSSPIATQSPKQKKGNMRLFIMAGVFIVLFVILGYMLLHMK